MEIKTLIQTAIDALPNSYVPYSRFHVAAALLCKDGTVYTGNNIENASYTPTVCAERCAFFKAVGDGKREFEAIVICGGLHGVITDYCPPCGVCRQVSGSSVRQTILRSILQRARRTTGNLPWNRFFLWDLDRKIWR